MVVPSAAGRFVASRRLVPDPPRDNQQSGQGNGMGSIASGGLRHGPRPGLGPESSCPGGVSQSVPHCPGNDGSPPAGGEAAFAGGFRLREEKG